MGKTKMKRIPCTQRNLKKLDLPLNFPCAEPDCERKPKWIVIESDGLFTIIYGLCEEHEKNYIFSGGENK
jgi:hypothetical protein